MYYAAMNSKLCKLTPIGKRYWKLVRGENLNNAILKRLSHFN